MSSTIRSHPITSARHTRVGLLSHLLSMLDIRRQRRNLAGLDDALLRDIGLDRADALRESQRALWDVPAERRK